MDAVSCRGRSPSAEAALTRMILHFGGTYRERWAEDYTLSVQYEDRTSVDAVCKDGVWRAVGGDPEWVHLLNSPECPAFVSLYFQGAASVYAAVKPYPVDYGANGKMLVNVAKLPKDIYKRAAWVAGLLIGWILERRFVGFSTEVPISRKLTRVAVGMLL